MPQCYPFFPNHQIFAWTNSQLLNFAIFPKMARKRREKLFAFGSKTFNLLYCMLRYSEMCLYINWLFIWQMDDVFKDQGWGVEIMFKLSNLQPHILRYSAWVSYVISPIPVSPFLPIFPFPSSIISSEKWIIDLSSYTYWTGVNSSFWKKNIKLVVSVHQICSSFRHYPPILMFWLIWSWVV